MTNQETAIFAMGCFWQPDPLFSILPGVSQVTVGYIGGHTDHPTYEQVCNSNTGHAEAVEIIFDPTLITYEQLLRIFWDNHNPTTPNQQGPDYGPQYRSAIFYTSESQQAAAEKSKTDLESSGKWPKPIVTEIVAATQFWPAEDYHQKYLEKRGLSHCHI